MLSSQEHWEDWNSEGRKTLETDDVNVNKCKTVKREDAKPNKEEDRKMTKEELEFITELQHSLEDDDSDDGKPLFVPQITPSIRTKLDDPMKSIVLHPRIESQLVPTPNDSDSMFFTPRLCKLCGWSPALFHGYLLFTMIA
jgi:hypothetical protein